MPVFNAPVSPGTNQSFGTMVLGSSLVRNTFQVSGATTLAGTVATNISTGSIQIGSANTSGAVLFVGSGGNVFANGSGFGWDNANGLLGLHTGGTAISGIVHIVGTALVDQIFLYDVYGALAGTFIGRRANGTQASPTALVANDKIVALGARGYDGTIFATLNRAEISLHANENWSTTSQGTYIVFATTLSGATARAERVRIANANMGMAGQFSSGSLVTGSAIITGNTSFGGGVNYPIRTATASTNTSSNDYLLVVQTSSVNMAVSLARAASSLGQLLTIFHQSGSGTLINFATSTDQINMKGNDSSDGGLANNAKGVFFAYNQSTWIVL